MNAPIIDLEARRRSATPDQMPTNIEAEQGLLGSIMMHNDIVGQIRSIVTKDHFAEEFHQRVFDVALELHEQGKPVTPATLKTYLGEGELAAGVTIPQYLARLAREAMPSLTAPAIAREIRDLAVRRDLIVLGESLAARSRDSRPSMSGVDIAAGSLLDLQRIAELSVAADTRRDAAACAASLIDRARAIARGELQDAGVSTGLPELDKATGGGFQPGTLWIIAGRPRMGKTIMATGFARKVATRGARDRDRGLAGYGSQIFSLEVTEDQIIARILADMSYSSRGPVTFGDIMRGALDESALWAVEEAQRRLGQLPLALDVASSLTVQEIAARVRSEKARMARSGVRLAVVFIDYLKFIRASDRYRGNRVYEVGEITLGLKDIAKAESVCVVLLAQVNRSVDSRDRKDRAPGLADLRDSGDLEADTDVVLFIDRESVRVKQSSEYKAGNTEAIDRFIDLQHKADLIIAKTRTGSEGTLSIWFDASASTFAAQAR